MLDTDYENFAIVYLCDDLPMDNSKEAFWLLSRTQTLSPEVSQSVEATIDKYFDRKNSFYVVTDQNEK